MVRGDLISCIILLVAFPIAVKRFFCIILLSASANLSLVNLSLSERARTRLNIIFGWEKQSLWNSSSGISSNSVSSRAMAFALRGSPFKRLISPKNSPSSKTVKGAIGGSECLTSFSISTLPLRMINRQ